MRRKDKKIGVKRPEIEKKPEMKPPVITPAPGIKETTNLKEAVALQKEGWVIIDIKSAQLGVRDKTWVLKKE